MNKILLLFSLLVTISGSAQVNYKLTPTEFFAENNVFDIPNKTAKEIYDLSKIWISKKYPNPSRFTIYDVEDKFIQIKYFFEVYAHNKMKIKYYISFEIKDEKVRVVIDNLKKSGAYNYLDFFDRDGKIKESERFGISIKDIENHVNDFVDDYLNYLKEEDNW